MKLAQILAVNYLRARLNLLAVISPKRAAAKAFDIFCTPYYKSNKAAPSIFQQALPLHFKLKGKMVNGFMWNKGGLRRVLLLHGFESSSKNFDMYVRGFIKKNYEVLAFDAPAHGISEGKHITLPLYIEMITAVYFKFGVIHSFMAHSFGGLALAHFLETVPHAADTRVALVAPATESRTAIDSFFRFLQLGNSVRQQFNKLMEEKSGFPANWYSIPRALQRVKDEILWIHDRDDDITPLSDVEGLMDSGSKNIHFFITQGLGHKKIYRDSKVIDQVVQFL